MRAKSESSSGYFVCCSCCFDLVLVVVHLGDLLGAGRVLGVLDPRECNLWEAEADALSWIHETKGGLLDRGHVISAHFTSQNLEQVRTMVRFMSLVVAE